MSVLQGSRAPLPQGKNICEVLRSRSAAWPHRTAVQDTADNALTFSELLETVAIMAAGLHEAGVRPGTRVAWQYEPQTGYLAAMLAIIGLGGVLVPLDAAHPRARREAVLSLAGCAFGIGRDIRVLTDAPSLGGLVWHTPDELLRASAVPVTDMPSMGPGGQHPWSLLFTSGSTGEPKGVLLPHDGVLRLCCAGNLYEPEPGDAFLCYSSPAFDAFVLETLLPLLNGAKTVLFPHETLSTPAALAQAIGTYGVNSLWLTAGFFHFLASENPAIFRPLRRLMAGGDTVRPDIARKVLAACPTLTLINGYGPTENSIFTTAHHIRPGSLRPDEPVPLGQPVAHTTVHVLKPGTMIPAEPGEWGEMCCSGPGVGLGYITPPGEKGKGSGAAPFTEAVFDGRRIRMYRSGDIVRIREDGLLEFKGRQDSQVKIRGHRLELGDVEAAIRACPGVNETCVLALADTAEEGKQLVAFVSGKGRRPRIAALRGNLAGRVPAFMLPARWIVLDGFPLNANGKIDRKRLAAVFREKRPAKARAAASGTERPDAALREMMAQALNLPQGARFTGKSDFFRAGGDSLRAMRFLAEVERRFGSRFTLAEFMRSASPQALAGMLDREAKDPVAAANATTAGPLPLTDAQRPFWLLQRIFPDSPAYNVPLLLEFGGDVDTAALWRALRELALRNDVLRARFIQTADGARQTFPADALPEGLDNPALVECSGPDGRERAMRLIEQEARRPFSVESPSGAETEPLCRMALYRARGCHLLLLTMFHGIIDHWGCDILLRDLAGLYAHFANGKPVPPPPGSFASVVAQEAARSREPSPHADALAWWVRHLAGKEGGGAPDEPPGEPFTVLPDYPRPAIPDFSGGTMTFRLAAGDAKALRRLARREALPLFVPLLCLWGLLVRRTQGGGTSVPVLGVPVTNRNSPAAQRTAGVFLHTLPFRLPLADETSFMELVREAADVWRDALAHGDVPVDMLASRLRGPQNASAAEARAHDALFRTLVTLTPALSSGLAHAPTPNAADSFPGPVFAKALSPGSKFDISALFTDTGETLDCLIEYRADLYSPRRIEHLAASFGALVHDAVTRPETPWASLNILSALDRKALNMFNSTQRKHAPLLPEQALQTALSLPSRIAVTDGPTGHPAGHPADEQTDRPGVLTFGEVHGRADRLARLLRPEGVPPFKPGRFAGLLIERSADNLIAVHAAHKAGLAFIPLDPALPDKRLASMIADAAPAMPILIARAAREQAAEALLMEIPAAIRPALVLLPEGESLAAGPDALTDDLAPAYTPAPFDPAYALFTSGSTGRPKCAVNTHRGLANRIAWMQRAFPLELDDVILHKTPLSFDVHVWELFWWSWAGCRVAVLEPGGEKDPDALCRAIFRNGVTTIHFVPSMLHSFLFWLEQTGRERELASLRRIFVSGEALSRSLAARCLRILPWAELHNLYGPTEAAIDVTWEPCPPRRVSLEAGPVPIGRPIDNTRVHVIDGEAGRLRLQPVGVPGELCLAGAQVGLGYLNRPELTRAVFVPDPFTPAGEAGPEGHMYRTGDQGRFLPDGRIEYLGRMAGDHQVKIRGQRIELGEIEAVLQEYPGIVRAVCGPVNASGEYAASSAESEYLAAWLQTDATFAVENLPAFVRSRLADAMVPKTLLRVNGFPLSANGKLSRAQLSLRSGEHISRESQIPGRADSGRPGEEPARESDRPEIRGTDREETRTRLQNLWAEVLPSAEVMRDDRGFFEAGGDSLSVIRLHALLEREWPGMFSIPDLFRFTTVSSQAEIIFGKNTGKTHSPGHRAVSRRKGDTVWREEDTGHPVAVIGMAVCLAGYADLSSFRDDVLRGTPRITALPQSRREEAELLLDLQGLSTQGPYAPAGYLDEVSLFAPKVFRVSPLDATLMDPSQRLFLRTAEACLQQAGGSRLFSNADRIGVFATSGHDNHYLAALAAAYPDQQERIFALNVPSNTATRLGYLLDWRGPAMVVDTACSSGLVAVHLACRSLRAGECDMALAGGARVVTDPRQRHLPILSSSGAVRAYDRNADGTCAGEGSVAFLLKPLDAALRDGNPIHAVLRGSAMNQGGAATGMAAPNPEAQAEALLAAAVDAGVPLASLGYIEGHGTGTRLGDPVELAGIQLAFEREGSFYGDGRARQQAGLGSAKAAFGHLDSPAGLLGLARAIVAVRESCLPPQPLFQELPPEIDSAVLPVSVSADSRPWPDRREWGESRRAGVSAFGLSGINCHVIVEEAPAQALAPWSKHRPEPEDAASLLGEAPLRRCWPVMPKTGAPNARGAGIFPLRQVTPESFILSVPVHDRAFWPASEHLLENEPVLVGMAVLDLFRLAMNMAPGEAFHVQGLVWHRPLVPAMVRPDSCHVRYAHPRLTLEGLVESDGREQWVVFAEALAGDTPPSSPPRLAPDHQRRILDAPVADVLKNKGQRGVSVSSRWDCLIAAVPGDGGGEAVSNGAVLALLRLPSNGPDRDFVLHPGLLDCAASLGLDFPPQEGEHPLVPAGCGSISVHGPLPDSCLAVFTPSRRENDLLVGDLLLTGHDGVPVVSMSRLLFRRTGANPAASSSDLEYREPGWERITVPATGKSAPHCLFWGEDLPGGLLSGLAAFAGSPLLRTDVSPQTLAGRLAASPAGQRPEILVVRLAPTENGALALADLIRSLHAVPMDPKRPLRLVCLGYSGELDAPFGSGFSLQQGLLAGADLESEALDCSWLDLHPDTPEGLVMDILSSTSTNTAIRPVRGNGENGENREDGTVRWHVFRPALLPLFAPADKRPVFTEKSIFVVTGGMGGIGLLLAEAILAGGGRAVLLHRGLPGGNGDTGGDEAAARLNLFRRLENSHPDRLMSIHADICDPRTLRGALDKARRAFGPPTGILHAAGIMGNGFLVNRGEAPVRQVLAPKIHGARLLHELTAGDPIEHFLLLSSMDSLYPSPGQADYVAANAWLNGFARWRRSLGLPALALALPPLACQGMAARHGQPGILRPERLAETVTTACQHNAAVIAVAPPGYTVLPAHSVRQGRRALPESPDRMERPQTGTECAAPSDGMPVSLEGRSDGAYTRTERAIASIWAEHLGETAFSIFDGFTSLGGDSMTGMKVISQINARLDAALTLIDLLAEDSLASLAAKVDGAAPSRPEESARRPDDIFGAAGELSGAAHGRVRVRATESQHDIWRSDTNQRAGTAYNLPLYFTVNPDVDPDRLQRALNALMAGHQALRLAFHEERSEDDALLFMDLLDTSHPEAVFPLQCLERRFETAAERDAFLGSLVRPFALDRFPLCRAALLHAEIIGHGRETCRETWLFLDVHHIVADGMTMELLCQDLSEFYDAPDAAARTEPEGMANYAAWRTANALSASHTRELAAFLRQQQAKTGDAPESTSEDASEILPHTDLPEERKRPAQYTFAGAVHTVRVPEDLLRAARARAKLCGVTTASFMLALWALVIQRHTGEEHVCITLGDAGRHMPGMERMAGQFTANLPMILTPGERTFEDFARSAQETMLRSMGFWLSSLGELTRELGVPFNPDKVGIMTIGFSYMNYGKFTPAPGSGLALTPQEIKPKHSAKADLIIFSTEQPGSLVIDLEYYADAFGERLMRQLADHFLALLRRVALLDKRALPALEADSQPAGEKELLGAWSEEAGDAGDARRHPHAPVSHLAEALRRQARQRPGAIALEDVSIRLTYGELWRIARSAAALLARAGVVPGRPVLLDMRRGAREKILHAAVLLCGGVCVPLDRNTPDRRVADIIQKLAEFSKGTAVHLLTDCPGDIPEALAGDSVTVRNATALLDKAFLLADTAQSETGGDGTSATDYPMPEGGSTPAYILFTSGSTGEPKGIVIPHRALTRLLLPDVMSPIPGDRVLQTAAPAFDAAVSELWETWGGGAALVVPEHEDLLDPERLADVVRGKGITHLFLTSALFGLMARTFPWACAGLRVLATAGEAADPEAFGRFLEACPETLLINAYGPAEAGIRASLHVVTPEDVRAGSGFGIPIGRPVPGTRLTVLDRHERPCPPWCWGELAIGGPGVCLGYLGREDLTATAFRPLLHANRADRTEQPAWFRTGDMVRWRPLPGENGKAVLEIRGRADSQVKIRGWRVEPAAVERALLTYPGVRGAAVVVTEGEDGKQLVACLDIDRNAPTFSLSGLRDALRAELAIHLMPSRYVAMPMGENLPLTVSGKVDRRALLGRLPDLESLSENENFAELSTPAEHLVGRVFAEVLKRSAVGRNDNFFSLGGHSLLASRVRNRLAAETGAPLTLGDLFRYPTAAELARHIQTIGRDETGVQGQTEHRPEESRPDPGNGPSPCTRAQARLYLESCLDDTGMAFTMPTLLELDPGLDMAALEKTLVHLMVRHEALRTGFVLSGGEPHQIIVPSPEPPLVYEDMRDGDNNREAALASLTATLKRPFQLDRPPLWRVHVIRLDHSVLFLLCLHHLLADGWAMRLLFEDMRLIYTAYGHDRQPELAPVAAGMREWALVERDRAVDGGLAWWREKLAGAPRRIELPLDYPQDQASDSEKRASGMAGASIRRTLSPDDVQALAAAAEKTGGSLSSLLLTLFAMLLHRLTGQADMVVGLGSAGRDSLGAEGLVGFLMNIVPVRLTLDSGAGEEQLSGLVARVREAMLEALDHQDTPYDELVRGLISSAAGREALFNVAFEYQNFEFTLSDGFLSGPANPLESADSGDLEAIVDTPTSKNDLTLFATHQDQGLVLRMEFRTGILDRETVTAWLDHYFAFIRAVIAGHEEPS